MLNAHEDLDSYERKQFPIPSYIQRSVSAPAIAEHVSEAILPAYQYEEGQESIPANPNRANPRMEFFDENHSGEANKASILSLINDTINRTPMDLIQHDFPSTPSSVYSKRIFEPELKDGELKVAEAQPSANAQAPRTMALMGTSTLPNGGNNVSSSTDSTAASLDQATKSLEKLYVSNQELSPKTVGNAQPQKPLLNQYGAGNGIAPSGSILTAVPSDLAYNGAGAAKAFTSKPLGPQSPYNTLLGNNPSAILNNGLNPLAPSVAMGGMLGMPQPMHQGAQPQGQPALQQQGQQLPGQHQPQPGQPPAGQPAYFVQQAVYLDANGQPMFYRPMGGQYGPEFMYQVPPDGSHLSSGVNGDPQQQPSPMQPAFMQFPAGMQQQGYWAPNPADQNGMPVFVATGNPQGMPGLPMMNDGRRMMYNPATGQYSALPGGPMPGMPPGSRGGMPLTGPAMGQGGYLGQMPYGANGMPMPGMMPRGHMMDHDMFRDDDHRGYGHDYRDRRDRDRDYGRRDDRDMRGGRDRDRDRDRGGRDRQSAGINPVRDSLVDEFRNTYGKSRQWGLRDLLGHVVAFCQDQHGSRFIQQRLEVCTDVDKQLIFDEIIPSAQSLMTDVFGNYVLQKLFEYGTPDQCESLAILLKGQAVQLAMQMYGCRVVQKALEYVGTPRLIELVQEFESPPLLIRCVHDSNGNHVIQKCIEVVSKASREAPTPDVAEYLAGRIQFIISTFQGKVKELSSHPYGCRVVQRILEHCSNTQKAVILEELRQCCTELVQDCYGNYVIQFVMQHGWEADRAVLIREVQNNLLEFSQHKFASNVVEKCLQYASKKDRDEMIWTIINVTFDLKNPVDAKGHCVLESMVRDPYANYVVQKVIDVSDDRQRAAIMRYVKENITQLRRYTYGKHIIVRLEKITNEKF